MELLFGEPQIAIASMLNDKLQQCISVSLVAGYITGSGIGAIKTSIQENPEKLNCIVAGAGTYKAYLAFDQLLDFGVDPKKLLVHLGWRSKNYMHNSFRPMLHSKVYKMDMKDTTSCVFVGSHNLTTYALKGYNAEAAFCAHLDKNSPVLFDVNQHINTCIDQAIQYQPSMKEAYAQYHSDTYKRDIKIIEKGMRPKNLGTSKITIVIMAEYSLSNTVLGKRIYFEMDEVLKDKTINADVHLYLFDELPKNPCLGLKLLNNSVTAYNCEIVGIEQDQGGIELETEFCILNEGYPKLKLVEIPFRPNCKSGMQQIRIKVIKRLTKRYEYIFSKRTKTVKPVLDETKPLYIESNDRSKVSIRKEPAGKLLYSVVNLKEETTVLKQYNMKTLNKGKIKIMRALYEKSPDSENYILMSMRRKVI